MCEKDIRYCRVCIGSVNHRCNTGTYFLSAAKLRHPLLRKQVSIRQSLRLQFKILDKQEPRGGGFILTDRVRRRYGHAQVRCKCDPEMSGQTRQMFLERFDSRSKPTPPRPYQMNAAARLHSMPYM